MHAESQTALNTISQSQMLIAIKIIRKTICSCPRRENHVFKNVTVRVRVQSHATKRKSL